MDRLSAMQVAQSNLREHQSGLEYMSVLLERAKSEIENSGFISERLRRKIFSGFLLLGLRRRPRLRLRRSSGGRYEGHTM